jgi:beta-galactosidase
MLLKKGEAMKSIRLPQGIRIVPSTFFVLLAMLMVSTSFARPNLALFRSVFASSVGEDNPPGKAVNGVLTDRWESLTTDSEWIYVDLGVQYAVDSVIVNWETAAGQDYAIQVATALPATDTGWTTVAHITNGAQGEKRSITFAPVQARYVCMRGYKRASIFAYSIWEFEVYGDAVACVPPVIAADPADRTFTAGLNTSFNVYADGTDMTFQWQRIGLIDATYQNIPQATAAYYSFKPAFADSGAVFRCVVSSPCGMDTTNGASLSLSKKAKINLACKQFAKCTSAEGGDLVAANVVDDDSSTRWGTDYKNDPNKDSAWVYVDLGAVFTIDSVFLNWEDSGAKEYLLQIALAASDNDNGWTTVAHITDGKGWEKRPIRIAQTQARFVRVRCLQRLSGFGYSMFEFEVYGPPATRVVDAGKGELKNLQPAMTMNASANCCIIAARSFVPSGFKADIYSMQGRLVRSLSSLSSALMWDYADMRGARVKKGLYLVRCELDKMAVSGIVAVWK